MLEQSQDAPFFQKALHEPGGSMLDQLDRHTLLELTVGAFAKKHLTHAALADRTHDVEGADAVGDDSSDLIAIVQQRARQLNGRFFKEAIGTLVSAQQLKHFVAQLGVAGASAVNERSPFLGRQIENGVEHSIHAPVTVVQRAHEMLPLLWWLRLARADGYPAAIRRMGRLRGSA
jgi:hypothetical protein